MGSDPLLGAELFVALVPSPEWVASAKTEEALAKEAGIIAPVMECPREERVTEIHLRAVLVVPLATVPKDQWPAFRLDLGKLAVVNEDGEVRDASFRLVDLEQRALESAKDKHPQLAAMVMRALAEAS